jgi:hypothetical protein
MEGILMVEWLPQGTAVNSVIYCGILTHLCWKIQQCHKDKTQEVLVLVTMPG